MKCFYTIIIIIISIINVIDTAINFNVEIDKNQKSNYTKLSNLINFFCLIIIATIFLTLFYKYKTITLVFLIFISIINTVYSYLNIAYEIILDKKEDVYYKTNTNHFKHLHITTIYILFFISFNFVFNDIIFISLLLYNITIIGFTSLLSLASYFDNKFKYIEIINKPTSIFDHEYILPSKKHLIILSLINHLFNILIFPFKIFLKQILIIFKLIPLCILQLLKNITCDFSYKIIWIESFLLSSLITSTYIYIKSNEITNSNNTLLNIINIIISIIILPIIIQLISNISKYKKEIK